MLVGVVMFVLALTILGLSLFSLSGYEAQFLRRSDEQAQAFYAASGGIERAKFALSIQNATLSTVKQGLPLEGVVYAQAMRWDDSKDTVGAIPWTGDVEVRLRALAVRGDARSMVEVKYTPTRVNNAYKNLITTSTGLVLPDWNDAHLYPPRPQAYLDGDVWQNDLNTDWSAANVDFPFSHNWVIGGVPDPVVQSYINAHKPGAPVPPYSSQHITFDVTGGTLLPGLGRYRFFVSPPSHGTNANYGFDEDRSNPTIDVNGGTAIWLVEGGLHYEDKVTVTGLNPLTDRLVIVATKGTDSYFQTTYASFGLQKAGMWFAGGLNSPLLSSGIPVLLSSDGTVAMDRLNAYNQDTDCLYLSIFAKGVFLMAPEVGKAMRMRHISGILPGHDLDTEFLDPLYIAGLLPNSNAGQGAIFTPVAGSWREVTEPNPN